jgi:hypothetical protein
MQSGLWHDAFIDGDAARDVCKTLWDALVDAGVITHTVDTIPYTDDFDRLYSRIEKLCPLTRNEVFVTLMNLRKNGDLKSPRKAA